MALKRIPPPSLSSDDEKDEHLTDGPDSDDEVLQESSSEDEQQQIQKIKSQKPSIQEAQSESEEEEDDDEEEEEQQTLAPAKKSTILKPQESDSESDSDFESGKTQHSPTASDFTIKPIASKPMVDLAKNKKPAKGKLPPATTVVVAKPPVKRAIEVEKNGSKDSKSKRVKVSSGDAAENEEKKSGINRLWSDDDEIALLQGIIDYRLKKGADPNADMGAFHEFIKENLHVDVSKGQLSDKIRRLKKKYQTNVEKGGEDPVFSKPHDCRSFELLKRIWGKGGVGEAGSVNGAKIDNGQTKKSGSKVSKVSNVNAALAKKKDEGKAIVVKEKPKGKDEINEGKAIAVNAKPDGKDAINEGKAIVVEKPKGKDEIKVAIGDFAEMYPYLNSALDTQWEAEPFRALTEEDRRLMKEKIGRDKKARELNEGFKMLTMKELEVHLKKLELMKETTGMFLSALK